MSLDRCPNCGYNLPTRAKIGEGTQKAKDKEKLNQNQIAIGQVLSESGRPLTVKQVQGILYKKGIKRHKRGEETPTGEWNYHLVQMDCSILLGLKLVSMTRAKEFFDEYGFGARPIPHYSMTEEQKKRFAEILARDGRLRFQFMIDYPKTCPKCGYAI